MKVIDKRAEKNDDWKVGDVVCFESYNQNIKDFGMEINSEKRLSEDQMMSVDWGDGYWFNYLRKRNRDQVTLVSLHTDNECYSFDSDEVEIEYCPKCGRKL